MTRYLCDKCSFGSADCPQCVAGGGCEVKEDEEATDSAEQEWQAKFQRVAFDVQAELSGAVVNYSPMHSAHEGYAVILEELHELWDEVRVKDSKRSVDRMRKEAIQVAAMAIRFVMDVCGGKR